MESPVRFFITYGICLFFSVLFFIFIHECGHGFGAQLDGKSVSTGFNRVGDPGKKPSDPDFRSEKIVDGSVGSSGFLGPFVTWIGAILFTVLLVRRSIIDKLTILIAACALSNSLLRLVPMIGFFLGAAMGRFIMEDESMWALRSVEGLDLPIMFDEFSAFVAAHSQVILSDPRIYFWPFVSLIISGLCFIVSFRYFYKLFIQKFSSQRVQWIYRVVTVIALVLALFVSNRLDALIRINW